jgi:acetylornithine/succinyldiaminopimelate/putrescine aminotransferase
MMSTSGGTLAYFPWRAAMSESVASQSDHLLGRLKQLQTRYPTLIRDVCSTELVVNVEFYLADVAIDATYCLLQARVTAVHRMDRPQEMSFQLPSLLAQDQIPLAIQTLDDFLQQYNLTSTNRAAQRREQ